MKRIQALFIAMMAAFGMLATTAHAALPANVSTEIDTAKTDMLAGLGLVIAAMVAVWGLKKLGQKLGWI